MEFNLSSESVINAGGGLMFFFAGLVILAVGRGSRFGWRLGAFAATFGLAYVVANLVAYAGDPLSLAVRLVPGLAAASFLGVLIVEVARDATASARRRVVVLATLVGLAVVVAGVAVATQQVPEPGWEVDFPLIFVVEPLLIVLLAASAHPGPQASLSQHKGRVLVGLSGALFADTIIMVTAVTVGQEAGWMGAALDGVALLFGAVVAYTAWLILRHRPEGAQRFARGAFAALLLTGLLGCVAVFLPEESGAIGPYGILRTVGAVLLVRAVVKYDVLGVPLPRVVRRGALAGPPLAVLFIVAQVAQNFFSANYGLLVGGALAGIFVFIASPIQRVIERSSDDQDQAATASHSARAGYKAALRAAMRDGVLTRREERHLAEVAVALGISPVQALDLRDEVERERA